MALSFMKRVNDDFYGTAIGIDYADEMSGKTTCVGSVASLDAEGHAMLHLNIRYCITAKAEDMIQNISAACKANGCEIKNVKVNAPNYFPRENPVLMAMTRAFQEITGLKTQPYVMSGGTYARKLPNAFGFGMGGLEREETTLFAPGHGSYHQPDEGLHLASFKRALLIFAAAMLEADRALD